MPALQAFEQIDAGGVDSRSNPINMPRNRALRCLNWVPKQAGYWELRWGYSTVSMSAVSAAAIHSIFPYRTWNGNKYVLFVQGTTLKTLDTATGTVTTPTVRGTAVASSAKGAGYFANNRFHYGNGADQKWFDGTTWRDNGLPALTLAQVQNVTITEGTDELTAAQASTISLTLAAGGSFAATVYSGVLVYVALFDISSNDIGPATISVASGRVKPTLNQKITVGNLLVPVNTNNVKLIGGTVDGGNFAWFFTNTSTAVASCTRSGNTLTVIATGHGLSTNDVVILSGTTNFDGVYAITVTDVNTFTATLNAQMGQNTTGANTTGGTCKRIVMAPNATTSVDVLAPTQDTTYQVNQNRGLAASSVGGSNPGYQFYAAIYNTTTGHVGNRIALTGRAVPTVRSHWNLHGLPNVSATDSEWALVIGRTGDGAAVPYVSSDNAGNWCVVPSGSTDYNVGRFPNLDASHELPTRNAQIPAQCNMFCVAGDYAYAADTASPTLRRSGSLADDRAGVFTGRPEQSWAANDIDTFPTGEPMTGMWEIDQEVFCGTLHDSAISVNLGGIQQWVGPWAVGIAGRRAGTKCGAHGFFWLSGDKQLCTMQQGVPVVVSDEYELAELSQIGDANLSTVELSYYRSAAQNKDELRIEGLTQAGTPYTIIHDFKLREGGAPGSIYGQGYSSQFGGILGNAFTLAQIRDGNGKLQVYAGGNNGQLYQLYSGADDIGNQYTADLILLINGGPNRPNVPWVDWYGDGLIQMTVGRNLQTSLALGAQFGFDPPSADADIPQAVPGAEYDFLYRTYLVPPEVQRLYVRFQLTSHSADGNLNLNSPPHVPLENYGRLYELIPAIGDERER